MPESKFYEERRRYEMGEATLWSWIKEIIGGWAFRIFLWSASMTEDEYFTFIYNQERDKEKV